MERHVIAVVLACLLTACGAQATSQPATTPPVATTPTSSPTATPSATPTPTAVAPTPTPRPIVATPRPTLAPTLRPTAPPTMTASVRAVDFGFSPTALTVRVGTRVTFTNHGAATHTFTANGGLFNSGDVASGQSYAFTFMGAGTFAYHCQIHPSMTATLTVTH
jgi:plastocyanin